MRRILWCALVLHGCAHSGVETRTVNEGQLILQNVPEIPEALREEALRYQNMRGAAVVDWDASGHALYIRTRFGDLGQIHRVRGPGRSREQLTFLEERPAGVTRRPRHEDLAYLLDRGGDEAHQVYLLNPNSGKSRLLSDGQSKNSNLKWSRDGRHLAFTSTRRDGASKDIWVLEPDRPEAARMVWKAPDSSYWLPVDWSADGRLLIYNYTSNFNSRVHVLDLDSGRATDLHAGQPDARRVPYGFGRGGRSVFFATDAGGEFLRLVRLDLNTGTEESVSQAHDWDVEDVVISHDRTFGILSVNAGGISELHRFDTRTLKLKPLKDIPGGVVGAMKLTGDDGKLALSINTMSLPWDGFVHHLRTGKTERWTFSEVGGLDASRFIAPELVSFESFDGLEISAFAYRARGPGPHPVVIYAHGGPEGQSRPYFYASNQLWMDQLGVTIIEPNVRGSTGYGKTFLGLDNGFRREDSVKDIGALLDWIARQPDLDAGRVAVIGGSYGGYMALASAVHYSDRLRAAIDVVGISNFATFLTNTKDYRRDSRRAEYGDERDPEMHAFLQRISPNNNVDRIRIPVLVIQGQNDPRVPVTEAEQMVEALRDEGIPVWYMNALNEGHGYRKKPNRDLEGLVQMMFLQRFLAEDGPGSAGEDD